jgi:ferritin
VILQAIGEPPAEFDSPLAVFETALGHEKKITNDIHNLYTLALEEKDYPSLSFLQWFIDEQVEEEEHVGEVVENIKRVSGVAHAMLMLDRELGQRPPPAFEGD